MFGVIVAIILTANLFSDGIVSSDAKYYEDKAAQVRLEIEKSNLDEYELKSKEMNLRVYEDMSIKAKKFKEKKDRYIKIMFFYFN